MNELSIGEHDLLSYLKPDTPWGALAYLVIFVILALLITRALRLGVHAAMTRQGHIDRTTISFLQQLGSAVIWIVMLILYAHLIPVLRSMGTALLAGASVASVVIGLAAQSTLGNLVAGVAITIYRPFRLGDTLQVAAPSGAEIGEVELISLGYTTLRTPDGRLIVLPNAIAASQVTVNLNSTYAPWPLNIAIRLSRDADIEAARQLALQVAREQAGDAAVVGCFLTRVDATAIALDLRLRAKDAAGRDSLRTLMLSSLPLKFAQAKIGTAGTELPTFAQGENFLNAAAHTGIRLYELALQNGRSASPYVWRIRYALAHKGLRFESTYLGFTEISTCCGGRFKTVPILECGGTAMAESWDIARYLDRAYPGTPLLFSNAAELAMVRLADEWFTAEVLRKMFRMYILDVHNAARPEDQPYFRNSRETKYLHGKTLEAFTADRVSRLPALRESLNPLRAHLKNFPFMGGEAPNYADYIVLGAFIWAASVGTLTMLAADDSLRAYVERGLDLYGGMARDPRMHSLFE